MEIFSKKTADTGVSLLAKNLRYLMYQSQLDPDTLSKKTGIAVSTINSLKRGAGNPTLSTLNAIANFFEVTISALTEKDLSQGITTSTNAYEIALVESNELINFLKNQKKYKNVFITEIDPGERDSFFAVKIDNNAMSPFFDKGTIFVVWRNTLVHDGDMVLVQFGKHPPCFRKVFVEGDSYFFKPIVNTHDESHVKIREFTIIGVVTKAIQNLADR